MRISATQKLLANPSVFRLSDLHLVRGDLHIARENFAMTAGRYRIISPDDISAYSLCCSGLIHYRRAYNTGLRKNAQLSDEIVRRIAPEYYDHHRDLIDLTDRYVAHSCNQYEQLAVTVQVNEGEDGIARFGGLGRQGASIELLSGKQIELSISLIDRLVDAFLAPQMNGLESEIKATCAKLSSNELRALPDGFAPVSDANPRKTRQWPHAGKY
jgi:hypothetical protein